LSISIIKRLIVEG